MIDQYEDSYPQYCAACVTDDDVLRGVILEDAGSGKCSQCGAAANTISLERLAEIVHDVYSRYAREADQVPEIDDDRMLWVDGGSEPIEILQTDLGLSFDIAERVLEYLADNYLRDQHHDPGPDLYDSTAEAFCLQVPPSDAAQHDWRIFVEQVRHHGRFFNRNAQEYLDSLFGPLLRGHLHDGCPPTIAIGPGSSVEHIYRGRLATNDAEQRRIYSNPQRELAVAPEALRRANRMNAEGVAAFYGALDRKTCLAELRPYVHSKVIVGRFRILRPLRILDLRLVDNAAGPLSWFDPEFPEKVARRAFIRNLHELIRRPIIPGTESMEYLPTQLIAEYLASCELDGVLYISSLISRRVQEVEDGYLRQRPIEERGLNIVLFAKSSASINDHDTSSRMVTDIYDLDDRQIVERSPETSGLELPYPIVGDAIEPTLELVEGSLRISEVQSIKYGTARRKVELTEAVEHERRPDF